MLGDGAGWLKELGTLLWGWFDAEDCWIPYCDTSGASLPGQYVPEKYPLPGWEVGVPPEGADEAAIPLVGPFRWTSSPVVETFRLETAGESPDSGWVSMWSSSLRPRDCNRASILLTLASSSSPKPILLPGFCLSR